MKGLERKYSFIKLNVYDETGKPERKINKIAIEHFDLKSIKEDKFIGRFVLDDDDCVSLKYFKIMKQYLNSCFEGFYISIGFCLSIIINDKKS